jgi:hypothetical protein
MDLACRWFSCVHGLDRKRSQLAVEVRTVTLRCFTMAKDMHAIWHNDLQDMRGQQSPCQWQSRLHVDAPHYVLRHTCMPCWLLLGARHHVPHVGGTGSQQPASCRHDGADAHITYFKHLCISMPVATGCAARCHLAVPGSAHVQAGHADSKSWLSCEPQAACMHVAWARRGVHRGIPLTTAQRQDCAPRICSRWVAAASERPLHQASHFSRPLDMGGVNMYYTVQYSWQTHLP